MFVDLTAECNGLAVTSKGLLFACEMGNKSSTHRIVEIDYISKKVRMLVESYKSDSSDVKFNSPNDLVVDGQDGVYFTDPNMPLPSGGIGARVISLVRQAMIPQRRVLRLFGHSAVENVYYFHENDSEAIPCLEGNSISKPNGIALSNNGKVLYVVESGKGMSRARLWAFAVDAAGVLDRENPKSVLLPHRTGDGMAVRSNNQLFVTSKDKIVIFDKDLNEIGCKAVSCIDKDLRGYEPSNICFVGNNEMYLTLNKVVWGVGWVLQWSESKLCKVTLPE